MSPMAHRFKPTRVVAGLVATAGTGTTWRTWDADNPLTQ
jgi:hypothetical protein